MWTIQCRAIVASPDPPANKPPNHLGRPIVVGLATAIAVVVLIALAPRLTDRIARPTPSGLGSDATGLLPSPSAGTPSQPPPDRGYLVSLAELRARVTRADSGMEPEASALRDLLAWADGAVNGKPKPKEPLRIDGTTGSFVDDSASAYGLALAWGATGDLRYATAARSFVIAWATTTRTLENTCPDSGCQTSLIIGRAAPGFVFAMDLLGSSGVLSAADTATFRDWLRTVILPAASLRPSNWGDTGALLRLAANDYLDDRAGFDAAIATWHEHLDLIAPDGHIPEEVRRAKAGLSYTQEALMYKLAVARIAERRGIDLWDAPGSAGGTLKKAVDFMAAYWTQPDQWQYDPHVTVPAPGPGWELAYAHWPIPTYAAIFESDRPFGGDGHSAVRWTTLTNGVPIAP
jgi:hypothetical protein